MHCNYFPNPHHKTLLGEPEVPTPKALAPVHAWTRLLRAFSLVAKVTVFHERGIASEVELFLQDPCHFLVMRVLMNKP